MSISRGGSGAGRSGSGGMVVFSSSQSRANRAHWEGRAAAIRDHYDTTSYAVKTEEEIYHDVSTSVVVKKGEEATEELRKFVEKRIITESRVDEFEDSEHRREIIEHSRVWGRAGRDYYNKEDFESGSIALHVANTLLDVAISVSPAGWAKDVYESVFAKNFVTGHDLTESELAFATLGALTGGFASKFKKAYDVFKWVLK